MQRDMPETPTCIYLQATKTPYIYCHDWHRRQPLHVKFSAVQPHFRSDLGPKTAICSTLLATLPYPAGGIASGLRHRIKAAV